MSNKETDQYQERLLERAAEVIDYFTSKVPAQITENLLDKVKKTNATDDWDRLEAYVRECEKVRFDNEYNPKEAYPDVY